VDEADRCQAGAEPQHRDFSEVTEEKQKLEPGGGAALSHSARAASPFSQVVYASAGSAVGLFGIAGVLPHAISQALQLFDGATAVVKFSHHQIQRA
jgi:hypothetical protein